MTEQPVLADDLADALSGSEAAVWPGRSDQLLGRKTPADQDGLQHTWPDVREHPQRMSSKVNKPGFCIACERPTKGLRRTLSFYLSFKQKPLVRMTVLVEP